jgi:heterodisulfide reductase subunit B
MQNLALIERSGFDEVVAPCSACYFRFKSAQHDLHHTPSPSKGEGRGEGAANAVGPSSQPSPWQGEGDGQRHVRVLSLLDLLMENVGLERLAARVVNAPRGLRVVSYYGCLLTRPPQVTGAEHAENVNSCPMCHVDLDARQAELGLDFQMPVVYITQLLGLAFGLPARALALHKHATATDAVVARFAYTRI